MYNEGAGRLILLTFPIIILSITTGLCEPCPDGCAGGCKEANCTLCIAGRWGESCERSCTRYNCLDNECDKRYGYSSMICKRGCIPGFVLYNSFCHFKCPQTCRTCEIRSHSVDEILCTSCNEGYTGYPHCQYSCVGCIGTFCNDNEGSSQCTLGCMEGYFTNSAMNYSRRFFVEYKTTVNEISICKKCKDNCSSCSSLEYCTSCIHVPGTYGQSCEHPCDPNCRNTACNSTTGVCENDCSSGYYTNGTTCESCPTCDDCETDPCKSSCCQATTPSICSVNNCDVCSKIDIDLCKECLDGYRVTGNGTCESNSGILSSGSSKGGDDDIVIGVAIGSSISVITFVAGLAVAIFVIKRKRLRQESRNKTETGEHVCLNDAVHGRSNDAVHGRFNDVVDGRSNDAVHGRSNDPVHGRSNDPVHGRSNDAVHGRFKYAVHGRYKDAVHGTSNDAVHGSSNDVVQGRSRNTNGNSQNIGRNSGNIDIRTTSTNIDDTVQHEYE